MHEDIKAKTGDKASIIDDVVFKMELVKQVKVNINYILILVANIMRITVRIKKFLWQLN